MKNKENPFTDKQLGFKRAFDEFGWDARGTSLMPNKTRTFEITVTKEEESQGVTKVRLTKNPIKGMEGITFQK